jgi:hypothetical protein
LLISILLITYVPIYVPLYLALGSVANALVLVAVIVVGWIFGMRAGILAGGLSYPLNVLLRPPWPRVGPWEIVAPDGVFGHVMVVISGAVVGRLHDLGERVKEQALELEHQVFHDPLTDLPNRALFMNRLEHALERTARGQESLAVLFLDLDRFKRINDSLGQRDGRHKLLIAVSERLRACVRQGETQSHTWVGTSSLSCSRPLWTRIRLPESRSGSRKH